MVGDFNGWDRKQAPMKRVGAIGVYETFIPEVKPGDLYKFCIETGDGRELYKADPYAVSAELRPGTASKVADISGFKWGDARWMEARKEWGS